MGLNIKKILQTAVGGVSEHPPKKPVSAPGTNVLPAESGLNGRVEGCCGGGWMLWCVCMGVRVCMRFSLTILF